MYFTNQQRSILTQAGNILEEAAQYHTQSFTDANSTATFLSMKLAGKENEVFACIFLDSQHRMIKYEEVFNGTTDSASVHPRVLVKRGLDLNCSAVIIAHNHPSGDATPSHADIKVTEGLKEALKLFDIRLLDHIIIGHGESQSLAKLGCM
jgi:DNA repair protein RadC